MAGVFAGARSLSWPQYIRLLAIACLVASCSDSAGPRDTPEAGQFLLEIRGAITLDLRGDAQLTPGLAAGTVQGVHLLSQTTSFFYRLEIDFVPPVTPAPGPVNVGPTAAVRAVFYMFDRQTQEYAHIAAAHSGTLVLEECVQTRCVGRLNASARLDNSQDEVTLSATFHGRIQ